jgi:iron complex transport system substrate-binding protein
MRIVSLISSATEIVHALGLTPFQVGRSHECDYPDEIRALPVCTAPAIAVDGSSAEIDALVRERVASAISVYEVSSSVLESLQPTHVITQTHCRVCAVSLDDVERALAASVSSRPKLVSLEPNSLDGIWSDIRRVASASGIPERGDRLVAELQARIERISAACGRSNVRPKVACIEWLEPLMASGNWVPELIDLANGENLFGEAGRHSPTMTWEQLLASDPDVVIVTPCGFDLERTGREMYWLTERPDWMELRAARTGQVYLIDGNQYMNRPGPRVVDSLEIVAGILHPGQVVSAGRWDGVVRRVSRTTSPASSPHP